MNPEKILILTVGGSCDPIVNAIREENPDFIYFVCSKADSSQPGSCITVDGPGKPCGNKPSIVEQAKISKDIYEKWVISDPDSLSHCYKRLKELAQEIKNKFKDAHVIANYTGGTKTMSVSLCFVAAKEKSWDLQVNKGPRHDLIKVRVGDIPELTDIWEVYVDEIIEYIKNAFSRYDYSSALESAKIGIRLSSVSEEKRDYLRKIHTISSAFSEWDKFDHRKAYELLKPYSKDFVEYKKSLEALIGRGKNAKGYELVGDLIRNAERRAYQARYDDAVARLYRALELFAQLRLKEVLNLEWEPLSEEEEEKRFRLKIDNLPEPLKDKYKDMAENGELKIGLVKDYELLKELKDKVGEVFAKYEKPLLDAIKKRNLSILAHGLIPLKKEDYEYVHLRVCEFLNKAAALIKANIEIPQLPKEF